MTKYHIEKNVSKESSKKFFIPKLNSDSSGSTSFSIPKINFSAKKEESESNTLADFAKLQLNKPEGFGKKPFAIPNIFNKPEIQESLEEEKALDTFVIDLKSALETDNKSVVEPSVKPSETSTFVPQFVDFKIVIPATKLDFQNCQILTLLEMRKQFSKIKFQKFSSIGKVLKKKFHIKPSISVVHNFIPKNILKPFNFDTPSPDDIVLKHLIKKPKKSNNSDQNSN